jgi:hypothetical protein
MFRFNHALLALASVVLVLCLTTNDLRAQTATKTPRQERVETITASGIPSKSVLLNNQGVLYTLDNDELQTYYGCVVSGFEIGNDYVRIFLIGQPPTTCLEFTVPGWSFRTDVGTELVHSEPVHINWLHKTEYSTDKKK